MRSGVFSATFSISMPPAWLAMMTGASGGAIEHDAQIQLARNRQALLDQQPRHVPALGAGLVRDQGHADASALASVSASAGFFASLTPPPLPRPPA